MDIKINSTNTTYSNNEVSGVRVHFGTIVNNDEITIHLNGSITLTAQESQGNDTPEKLKEIVRAKIIERLGTNVTKAK